MSNEVSENGNIRRKISTKRDNFTKTANTIFKDKETADFWFLFGSGANQKRLPVHKAILANKSEAFKSMFYGEAKELKNEFKIGDAGIDEFTEFAQYLYTDTVAISADNVAQIMYLAKKYLVTDLLDLCDEFIINHLIEGNILFGLDLAIAYDRLELKATLEETIGANAKNVFTTTEFRKCTQYTLKNILNIDQLMCYPTEVFDACIDWAKNRRKNNAKKLSEMENIKIQLGECLHLIPFYLMSSERILKIAIDYKKLFDQDELVELMSMMSSSGKVNLNKFKYKNCYAPYSNANWHWLWAGPVPSDEEKQWICRKQSVKAFFVNKMVLKALKPCFIWHIGQDGTKMLSGKMKIVQMATPESNEKIVMQQAIGIRCRHTRSCSESCMFQTINFDKPFVMEPKTEYEIQFEFDDSWSEKMFYTMKTCGQYTGIVPFMCYKEF